MREFGPQSDVLFVRDQFAQIFDRAFGDLIRSWRNRLFRPVVLTGIQHIGDQAADRDFFEIEKGASNHCQR